MFSCSILGFQLFHTSGLALSYFPFHYVPNGFNGPQVWTAHWPVLHSYCTLQHMAERWEYQFNWPEQKKVREYVHMRVCFCGWMRQWNGSPEPIKSTALPLKEKPCITKQFFAYRQNQTHNQASLYTSNTNLTYVWSQTHRDRKKAYFIWVILLNERDRVNEFHMQPHIWMLRKTGKRSASDDWI